MYIYINALSFLAEYQCHMEVCPYARFSFLKNREYPRIVTGAVPSRTAYDLHHLPGWFQHVMMRVMCIRKTSNRLLSCIRRSPVKQADYFTPWSWRILIPTLKAEILDAWTPQKTQWIMTYQWIKGTIFILSISYISTFSPTLYLLIYQNLTIYLYLPIYLPTFSCILRLPIQWESSPPSCTSTSPAFCSFPAGPFAANPTLPAVSRCHQSHSLRSGSAMMWETFLFFLDFPYIRKHIRPGTQFVC